MSIASLLLGALALPLQTEERPFPLMVGDPAPAIQAAEWVQGEPVSAFNPGQVYVVEFWATWCGPCKVAIPHLNELSRKYTGATFIGVSVWERISAENPYKVPEFVKSMGEQMTYRVVADQVSESKESGPMAKNWMEAAGQGGIPTAFVVDRAGKIAWIGHPMSIDEPLAKVVAGTWDLAAAAKKHAQDIRLKAVTTKLGREISKAKKDKDYARAIQLIDEGVAQEAGLEATFGIDRYFLLLEAGRTPEAAVYGQRLVQNVFADSAPALNQLAWWIVDPQAKRAQGDFALAVAAAERAVKLVEEKDASILDTLGLALFKHGQIERAIHIQEKAVALAAGQPGLEPELKSRLAEFKAAKAKL
ncbi:MAG TPA: redoxin family protein [Planctomycetota bacterium]